MKSVSIHPVHPQRGGRLLRTALSAFLLTALVACGGGDDDAQDAATTVAVDSDDTAFGTNAETTTTEAEAPDDTTTTTVGDAASDDPVATGAPCPLDDGAVSEIVGATVAHSPDLAADMAAGFATPEVAAATDFICAFSTDGTFAGLPMVLAIGSDHPGAEAVAMDGLGSEAIPVDGIGDSAFASGTGEVVVSRGAMWMFVTAAVPDFDPAAGDAIAQAIARLLAD